MNFDVASQTRTLDQNGRGFGLGMHVRQVRRVLDCVVAGEGEDLLP